MPTYDYQCKSCGHTFEAIQKMSDDPLVQCPSCNKNDLVRLVSAPAFHLKGSGWYKTDYSGSSTGNEPSTSSATETSSSASTTTSSGDKD